MYVQDIQLANKIKQLLTLGGLTIFTSQSTCRQVPPTKVLVLLPKKILKTDASNRRHSVEK